MTDTTQSAISSRLHDEIGEEVDEALAELARLGDEGIAAYLQANNFGGERDHCDRCPIANYVVWWLRKAGMLRQLIDPWVCVDTTSATVMYGPGENREDITCHVPYSVRRFMGRFDAGDWDALAVTS